jgi:molybdenum cofactor guanylyltransferase
MIRKNELTGIILAGGRSSRLGTDKGLLTIHGKTLLELAAESLAPFCSTLLVSTSNDLYQQFRYKTVPDLTPDKGPMMGVYSCLRESKTHHHLLLAVDNFNVGPSFFSYLLEKSLAGVHAAIPFVNNRFYEPLAGYYSKDVMPVMEALFLESNYKLPDLFEMIPVLKLVVQNDFPEFHKDYFKSLNNPADLSEISG